MKYSTIKKYIFLCLISFFFVAILSCPATKKVNREVSNSEDNENLDKNLTLDKAYVEPSPTYDILLNTKPTTAEKVTDKKKIIENINERIDEENELFKYLEQKRQYVKSSIFAETP